MTNSAGVLLCDDGEITEAPFVPVELRGRSGRGDTCAGAYLARRLTASPREALFWTAAVTSLKLETEGPFLAIWPRSRRYTDGCLHSSHGEHLTEPLRALSRMRLRHPANSRPIRPSRHFVRSAALYQLM